MVVEASCVVEVVKVSVSELERVSVRVLVSVADSETVVSVTDVLRLDSVPVLVELEGRHFPAAAMPAAIKNKKEWTATMLNTDDGINKLVAMGRITK